MQTPSEDEGWSRLGSALLPQHQEYLSARGVTPEVARERGYRSADTKSQLRRLGFSAGQAEHVPALIIPNHNVLGEVAGFQFRSDVPRVVKGRVSKFELPQGASLSIDVPPRVRPLLARVETPLFITEGAVKADAAASQGLACVALFGVYGWRTKSDLGGTTVAPELEYLSLKGRRVFLAFDSDVLMKPQVHDALSRLYRVLEHRGADVGVILLPAGDHAEKTGLDDYFARGGSVDDLYGHVSKTLPRSPTRDQPPASAEPIVNQSVTLSDLLEVTEQYYRRFIVFSNEHQSASCSLWVAHAWFIDAADISPRLLITAPVRRAAKSRVLDVTERMVPNPKRTGSTSGAAIFRVIDKTHPTLLVDEIDRVFKHTKDDSGADLIAQVINIGWERGNHVLRVEGNEHEVHEYESFAATALAGIDKGALPETVVDRSVRIQMRRRQKGQPVEKFRRRGKSSTDGDTIRRHWAGYVQSHPDLLASLSGAYPEMPDELHDRAQDAWEPLVAIADAAGGDWPSRARAAAVALSGGDEEDDGPGVQILADLHEVWPAEYDAVRTKTLVDKLVELEDSPWQTWGKGMNGLTGSGLAWLLKPFDIRPTQISVAGKHDARGYTRAQFEDAWARYLFPGADLGTRDVHPVHPITEQGKAANTRCPPGHESWTFGNGPQPLRDNGVDEVDTSTPESEANKTETARTNGAPGVCDECGEHRPAVRDCVAGWLCDECILL
jgi:hypothetical protein